MKNLEFDVVKYTDALQNGGEKTEEYQKTDSEKMKAFLKLCDEIRFQMDLQEGSEKIKEETLNRQIKALLGNETEINYYINKISQIIEEKRITSAWYPKWYKSLADGIYHEAYGFAGISNWLDDNGEFGKSTSCKIIGQNIFYDVDGVLVLQEQKISRERFDKLRTTLLAADPRQLKSDPYHEIYFQDEKRVTIYNDNGVAKKRQPIMIFRRYLEEVSTLEGQAEKHTIPYEAIPFFKYMIKCGFNKAYIGPVKSAKTTNMMAFQSYEDENLEELLIETDPEIPLHKIKPHAPCMQLVPDEKYMSQVIKIAKRSDAQAVNVGEARDGRMMNIVAEAANMGTRHLNVTLHTSETVDFAFDVADKITRDCGGDLGCNMIKVAKSFHYLLSFYSLPNNRKEKRLKGVWEMYYDNENMRIIMHRVCRYRPIEDDWVWNFHIGKDKTEIGIEENYEAYKKFEQELILLAEKFPEEEGYQNEFEPAFLKFWKGRG